MKRRRPVDRASDIVAQHRQAELDAQADEAMAHEGWKRTTATNQPDYLAGLAKPTTTPTRGGGRVEPWAQHDPTAHQSIFLPPTS